MAGTEHNFLVIVALEVAMEAESSFILYTLNDLKMFREEL